MPNQVSDLAPFEALHAISKTRMRPNHAREQVTPFANCGVAPMSLDAESNE